MNYTEEITSKKLMADVLIHGSVIITFSWYTKLRGKEVTLRILIIHTHTQNEKQKIVEILKIIPN